MADDALEAKMKAIREAFIIAYTNKLKPGFMVCCSCGGKIKSNVYSWHWTGYTFHLECMPED